VTLTYERAAGGGGGFGGGSRGPSSTSVGSPSSSQNPSMPGQSVTFTVTVSPTPDGGTVQFTDPDTTIAGCGAVPVSSSTGEASCTTSFTAPGSYQVQAVYSGDSRYSGSSSPVITQVVAPAASSTALSASPDPSVSGQRVLYTAALSPIPDGGTVAFTDGGVTITGCGSRAIDTASGRASCQVSYSSAGSHQIQAVYSGDASFGGSRSATLIQTVKPVGSAHHLARPGLRLRHMSARAPGRRCRSEVNQASIARATTHALRCGQTKITFTGTISQAANGQQVTIILRARINAHKLVVRGHVRIRHGRYTLIVNLPAGNTDASPHRRRNTSGDYWTYTITYPGNTRLRAATVHRRFRLEAEPR
jgi:hypothetical protein